MRARLYWIDTPLSGRLAIAPRPLGGDDLDAAIADCRSDGVDRIVRLLEPHEIHELKLAAQASACARHDIQLDDFPIPDRGVPANAIKAAALARRLRDEIAAGKAVLIHCRAGIGRSALIAAAVLVAAGVDPNTAFERIHTARHVTVPDTDAQRLWVVEHMASCAIPSLDYFPISAISNADGGRTGIGTEMNNTVESTFECRGAVRSAAAAAEIRAGRPAH
ncbi:hypothetical protein sos41_13470 [Alphaproteobacteria bacterium SO-S41]|nr:hypothetical protein sos41_13470 [Alphaproteobacteria bacterium SO-S41]